MSSFLLILLIFPFGNQATVSFSQCVIVIAVFALSVNSSCMMLRMATLVAGSSDDVASASNRIGTIHPPPARDSDILDA